MIPITTTTDLLKAQTIKSQLAVHGSEVVLFEIKKWLSKCAMMLDIEINGLKLEVLANDIIDRYPSDSLEDVQEALKKGRQGLYSDIRDAKTYGKMNMEVITKWISLHLEEKVTERERYLHQHATQDGDRLIDRIVSKSNEINEAKAQGKEQAELDAKINELNEMQSRLTIESQKLKDKINQIKKRKMIKTQEFKKYKSARDEKLITDPELKKKQVAVIIKHYSTEHLSKIVNLEANKEFKEIIEQEIANRQKGKK